MQQTSLVKEVTRRTVTPKNGAPAFLLYEIEDANGIKWTTKKDDLALTAHTLVGKTATFEGLIKENGQWKNYYLNGIWEASDIPAPDPAPFIPETTSTSTATIPDTTEEKETRISRMTATKVAAHMSEGPGEFWQNVQTLMTFYVTGQHPEGEEYATTVTQTPANDPYADIPF